MASLLNNLFSPQSNASQASGPNPNIAAFQRMANMLNAAKNPNAAINALAQQNPQMREVMQLCQGKNPKDVFIQECKNRGLDPNALMNQLGLH